LSSGFSKSDLDSFFDTDGVAVATRIFTPDDAGNVAMTEEDPPAPVFLRSIKVIFSSEGQPVDVYSDTNVEGSDDSFLCKTTDLAGVKKGMQVDFPDLEAHEEGYGQAYEVTSRIAREGPQTSRVYLKEL
jgi:hypothetical protein